MPEADQGWIEDPDLGLAIGGGYDPPLTDREASIAAAQAVVDRLRGNLGQQEDRLANAAQAATRAKEHLAAAKAAAEIILLKIALAKARETATSSPERIAAAQEQEETARNEFSQADAEFSNAAQRRQTMQAELTMLQHGSSAPGGPPGLTQLAQSAVGAREKASRKREAAESLRMVAGLSDLDAVEAVLAQSGTVLDQSTMQDHFHTARILLRRAAEEVLAGRPTSEPGQETGDEPPLPALNPLGGGAGKTHQARLAEELREFRGWCDSAVTAEDSARPFDLVERPLRAWLDWHGSDDDSREGEIRQNRIEQQKKMDAAERKSQDMLLMLKEAQLLHIRTIEQMFQNTERTLQDLLSAVGRAPVALRARPTDVHDADQWLRWEVFPQWLPPGRTPVDYRNPPNTAELIILHLLLATSALVSATSPRGRMLILDESGNNLDAPSLRRVSEALRQIADKYGLTMVLACQDLYTSLVSEHSTGMIQLVRTSPKDILRSVRDFARKEWPLSGQFG